MQVQLDFFAAKERKERKDKSLCCFFFAIFTKILPRMARITRISFEQKGTKETKEEFFFVAFVCFCANSVRGAARMGNSESVKSVVQFLWLRLAALGLLRLLAAIFSFPQCYFALRSAAKCG